MSKLCSNTNCNKYHTAKTRDLCKDCFSKMNDSNVLPTSATTSTSTAIRAEMPIANQYSQFNSTLLFGAIGSQGMPLNHQPRQPSQFQHQQFQQLPYAGLPQTNNDVGIGISETRLVALVQHAMKPLENKIDQIHTELLNRVSSLETRVGLVEKNDDI